jgi:regulator of sirC expression with transglutaminase-like and TPR domain
MDDPTEYLRQFGQAADKPGDKSGHGPRDIATAALMLSALDHLGRPLEPYRDHLAEIAQYAKRDVAAQVEAGAHGLSALLASRYGYDGDRLNYDDPQNADLMAVIDRRRGLPVALGILYIHAARAAGFEAMGLNTPGHFLLRLSRDGHEALIDPFNGGAALDRERLGAPPVVSAAEDPQLAQPVGDIEVLLRLQNNLKLRALQAGARARALEVAGRMVLIAPRMAELWVDLARLNEATGALGAAKKAYESCLALAKLERGLHNEAALALDALKRRLN